jgi:hypothetical protein
VNVPFSTLQQDFATQQTKKQEDVSKRNNILLVTKELLMQMKSIEALLRNYSKEEVSLLVQAFVEDLSFWEASASKSSEQIKLIDRLASEDSNLKIDSRRGKKSTRRSKNNEANPPKSPQSETNIEHCNWRSAVDPVSKKFYYYDTITRKPQWEKVGTFRRIYTEFPLVGTSSVSCGLSRKN